MTCRCDSRSKASRDCRQRLLPELPPGFLAAAYPATLVQVLARSASPKPGVPDAERVTHKTRCLRKRPDSTGVLVLYLFAALRERILFIFPSE